MKRSLLFGVLVALLALSLAPIASAKPGRKTVRATTVSAQRGAKIYTATLRELNGSGVTGVAYITKLPGQILVQVSVKGLASRYQHLQGIYGFADGTPAAIPGDGADTNGDGFIQLNEAMKTTGPLLLALTPTPTSRQGGMLVFNRVYRGASLAKLDPFETPLSTRVIMLQGGYWQPAYYAMPLYDPELPVAAGTIVGPSS